MNPDITDTLLIAAIGVAGGAGLIFIQVLVQWSLRKKHPAPAELPYAMVEEIAPRVEAPPPPKLEAPTEVVAKPPPTPEPVLPPPAVEAPAPPTPSAPKAPPRLGLGLRKTRESFLARIRTALSGTAKLSEIYEGLEEALIGADVGVDTSLKLTESLRGKLKNESRPDTVREALKSEISAILEKAERPMADSGDAPLVIMLVGVNGVGKTTTIAKLAARYKESRGTVLVAAADTFRAAAIEQLEVWCNRAGVEIIKQKQGSDPAAVAFDAVKAAVARKAGVVLIDTAGRLQTKSNLMEELKKIGRVIAREMPGAPHEVWLVLDATTGQNALSQAKIFGEAVALTGAVLAKLDSTAKGGVIVGIAGQLGIPVRFVGLGEELEDLREFDPREFVDALFASGEGEGDIASSHAA
ncbi:MAG TPA: signal recognition particle-docking protein FtsY [Candidatus Binataceae bacterium]|nr:signal recognition particle-docking protein FtsY [Candidatus Binataceae bacterium]